jgi:hypothetical protein
LICLFLCALFIILLHAIYLLYGLHDKREPWCSGKAVAL